MACQYYDSNKKMCGRSSGLVRVSRDRIIQHCTGDPSKCPTYRSSRTSYSWDEQAKNQKANARGNKIRVMAPVATIAMFLLCLLKFKLSLLLSLGGAAFVGLTVLMFTNRYH